MLIGTALSSKMFKLGMRSDFVTSDPDEEPTFAKFAGNVFVKTYDQRLYQYSQDEAEETVKLPLLTPSEQHMQNLTFDKYVPAERNGLHREIVYKLSFNLPDSHFLLKSEKAACKVSIIDYCDNGFYIDYEEVEQQFGFKLYESDKMDIEKMDAVARQYTYVMEFNLDARNFTKITNNGGLQWQLNIEKSIPYHLRYGEANRAGRVLYRLYRAFDVASDCWRQPEQQQQILQLRENVRYSWAFDRSFADAKNDFAFAVLDGQNLVQNFMLPVGNTEWTKWIQMSTKGLILYGMVVTLLAIFLDFKKPAVKKTE